MNKYEIDKDYNIMIEILSTEYTNLKLRSDKLRRLEDAGVDNWEGYDEAMSEDYLEDDEIDEFENPDKDDE